VRPGGFNLAVGGGSDNEKGTLSEAFNTSDVHVDSSTGELTHNYTEGDYTAPFYLGNPDSTTGSFSFPNLK